MIESVRTHHGPSEGCQRRGESWTIPTEDLQLKGGGMIFMVLALRCIECGDALMTELIQAKPTTFKVKAGSQVGPGRGLGGDLRLIVKSAVDSKNLSIVNIRTGMHEGFIPCDEHGVAELPLSHWTDLSD